MDLQTQQVKRKKRIMVHHFVELLEDEYLDELAEAFSARIQTYADEISARKQPNGWKSMSETLTDVASRVIRLASILSIGPDEETNPSHLGDK